MKYELKKGNQDCLIMIGEENTETDCTIIRIKDIDWNRDLSPWESESVFKNGDDFSGQADKTIHYIQSLPLEEYEHIYLCGYSLAGLFSLYTLLNGDQFDGCVCCSSSFWYKGFVDYVRNNKCKNKKIYISLGNKENQTKNPIMKEVLNCTQEIVDILKKDNVVKFEINEGNHFYQPDKRIQKGIQWIK